jgi:hypothetical protein
MDTSTLKIVGQIAGIGGLALGVFLIIFRNIIRKNIFPTFTKEQSYKIIRLMIVLTFIIAALGIFAWIYTYSSAQKVEKEQPNIYVTQDMSNTQTQTINLSKIINERQNKSLTKNQNTKSQVETKRITCPGIISSVPVFNYFPVTFDDKNTPLCHDFPMIDVAKDTINPSFSQSEDEYKSIRKFNAGDVLVVLLYINNGAASNLDRNITTAKNVKISTSITNNNNLYTLTATFAGDNVESKSGSVHIQTNPEEYLETILNSGFMYNYEGITILDQQNLNFGNSTFVLGDLDADLEYSLFLSFKIKVVKKQ